MTAETTTLHHAYRWTIPADHPTRQRYDRAVLAVRHHLAAGDQASAELLAELVGDLDASVDAMLEAVGNSVEQFYAPAPPVCRCEFLKDCERAGAPQVHDEMLADLGGENGIEGISRFAEHLALTDECDMPAPRMAWTDVEQFVAQHNWPDPVSTFWLATVLVDGRRWNREARKLRQNAG